MTQIAEEHQLCKGLIGLEKIKSGSPCFGRQLKRCKGACTGEEPRLAHDMRLIQGLARLKIQTWPFNGPAYLQEGQEILLVNYWAYLGSARSEDDVLSLLGGADARFDRDTYNILVKIKDKLRSLDPIFSNNTPAINLL